MANCPSGVRCLDCIQVMAWSGLKVRGDCDYFLLNRCKLHISRAGEVHKRQRKVMLPGFGAPEIKRLFPLFTRHAEEVRD